MRRAYAQRLAEALPGPRIFVATCPVLDDETRERIRRHREARAGRGWETIEEQLELAPVLQHAKQAGVVLVDCLTLWINNLMYRAEQQGREVTEDEMVQRCREVLDACAGFPGVVVFVTNEVGMSIVPDNPACRRFRDLAGRCNQAIAAAAESVALLACGLPLILKGKPGP
ncbi:MAG: bifunctional adenosylcobinamide kinase/adenosylcobinamide-phosphate guanylyltransferase [Planctomycetota bacterium]|nr:bifunctional adenosylcobinamide kinase/adenosylcobinamide-phosphate guanylyltransferase [Planctomycetota bacterium]